MNKKSLKWWLTRLETQHSKKIDLGLERVKQVYSALSIEKIAPTIITVAGTNGKGSTVAILSAICQQAGYKVGEFTSPHLLNFNERIKINNVEVSDDEIIQVFECIELACGAISLSYFEYATLAATIVFKQQQVDVALLEVGLGGRLDSVNVIDADCAIITSIDIDHTNWLGDTIELIAYEKAGIMRKNKPVIYGDVDCPKAISDFAKKINAKLVIAKQFDFNSFPQPNLNGLYQYKNAATAYTALKMLKRLKISNKNIVDGLKNIQLTGRLQVIGENPAIIIDVSHNKQAAQQLAKWLCENPIKGQTYAVFAVLADKKPIDWLDYFSGCIDVWCISQVQSERALAVNDLLQVLAEKSKLICSFTTVTQAFEKAQLIAEEKDRIIVFGSFYTVSEVLESKLNDN